MTCYLWVEAVISVKSVSWVGDGGVSGVSLSVVSSSDDKNGETAGNGGIWPDDGSSDGSDSALDAGEKSGDGGTVGAMMGVYVGILVVSVWVVGAAITGVVSGMVVGIVPNKIIRPVVHVHSILSNLIVESFTIPKRRNCRRSKQIVKPELQTIVETPVATMADTRTMSELLQAPTEGYGDVVIPAILAENFELKVRLLSLVTLSQFHGFERDDPHSHIRWFNKITSTLKYKNVPHDAIKLLLFPFSLEGQPGLGLKNNPLRFDETFSEACDHFKDLLRKCSRHGFIELHQIDTFHNALTQSNQDSLNAAAGRNLLNRTPRDALTIIENKSKVHTSRKKPIVSKLNTTTSSPSLSQDVTALTEIVKELDLEVCLALADIGASINLMPLFVLKKLSLTELTPTRMTLKLANRSVAYPVVDYDVDPRVPLIPERPFLRTARALINVHGVCSRSAQEVLGFSDSSTSGNPTPSYPIIASSSPSFTPFEGGDFILEEIDTFLRTSDELFNLDGDYYDTEGDILYLKKLLNKDSSLNLPPMKNDDLKEIDVTMTKPSIEELSELELNDLPSHLEYAF
uniref:Reverse transcriptase domain-containing protein n=1 Tax=Tanacetum cinerariifolium TaxID=118510 RepID=A0A6L2J0K0_TANCI|nr:reverse transcriptase domain-containing protein [Tanacetum cinerariifolium]